MEIRDRAQMDPAYLWDLTPIYGSDDAWRKALEEARARVDALSDISGTLGRSAEDLKAGLDRIYAASECTERVYCYAFLKKSGDGGAPVLQEMEARAISLMVALETATAFLRPEILAIPAETLAKYMEAPMLSTYRHMLEDIVRGRGHTLDSGGERILAMLGDAAQTPDNAFTMLSEVDMRFSPIRDERGEEVPLTHGSFGVYRESRDARVRREAFESYFGEYKRYQNTLAAIYGGSVKQDCFNAEVRGYQSACEAALCAFPGILPQSSQQNLLPFFSNSVDVFSK